MRWVEGADERRRARKAMQWWTERSLVSCWLRWREFHIEYTEAAYILTARAWGEWAEAAETTRNKRGTMLRAMAKMNSRKGAAALARWTEVVEESKALRGAVAKALGRFMKRALSRSWGAWSDYIDTRRNAKRAMRFFVNRTAHAAFSRW